jgi:hypothetical protein
MPEDLRPVIIHEVKAIKVDGQPVSYVNSGRELHVYEDFPIFSMLNKEQRKSIFESGQMGMEETQFEPIFTAVYAQNLLNDSIARGEKMPAIVSPQRTFHAGKVIPFRESEN